MDKKIFKDLAFYYSQKILKFGASAKGVDWKDVDNQIVRFKQLAKLLPKQNFSVADVGCGYGEFFSYLQKNNFKNFYYTGYDLSEAMIKQAKNLFNAQNANFLLIKNLQQIKQHDFIVASGIFNVKFDFENEIWINYVKEVLYFFDKNSKKGFAFNFLSKYSDKNKRKKYLFYADPLFWFDYSKKNFSENVALLHDYGLYDFTIIVRK